MAEDCLRSVKLYVCKHCGKQLRSSSALSDHERTHTGKAPYRCCGQLYFSRGNLSRHRCAKHGESRSFSCDHCGRNFALRTDLQAYMKTHEEGQFKCEECGLQIRKRSQYDDHISMHKGEKRHVCEYGKAYVHNSSLSRHRRVCQKKSDISSPAT